MTQRAQWWSSDHGVTARPPTDNPRRRTIAPALATAGGATLLYFLVRAPRGDRAGGEPRQLPVPEPSAEPVIRILSGDKIEVDGSTATLDAAMLRAAATGRASVQIMADARYGFALDVLRALHGTRAAIRVVDWGSEMSSLAKSMAERDAASRGGEP